MIIPNGCGGHDSYELWERKNFNLNRYELIITDLNLPGTDGIEVIRKLAKEKKELENGFHLKY